MTNDNLPPLRELKIEEAGDFWRGLVKPKIRLTGKWLARAGFQAGGRVQVACITPGVLELRFKANTESQGNVS